MKEAIIKCEGDSLGVYLKCEIDHHTAKTIREEVDKELGESKSKTLVFDFTEVNFMDSSGIGLILGRADKAETVGAKLIIRGLSPMQRKLIRMSGIEKLKNISVL